MVQFLTGSGAKVLAEEALPKEGARSKVQQLALQRIKEVDERISQLRKYVMILRPLAVAYGSPGGWGPNTIKTALRYAENLRVYDGSRTVGQYDALRSELQGLENYRHQLELFLFEQAAKLGHDTESLFN